MTPHPIAMPRDPWVINFVFPLVSLELLKENFQRTQVQRYIFLIPNVRAQNYVQSTASDMLRFSCISNGVF